MKITRSYLESLVCERFLTDERYRRGHLNILAAVPGTLVLGLHTPQMKQVARTVVSDGSWRDVIEGFASHLPLIGEGGLSHEERMIWGLIIDFVKCSDEDRLALIDSFLPSIDNWAICDNFCCNSKWAEKVDRTLLRNYLNSLFHSGKPWHIRVATVLSMCHFLGPEDIADTFALLDSLSFAEGEPYYVRMGVAWLLATALAKNQVATLAFVRNCRLPSDMLKLYVRKARESRITHDIQAL